MVVPGCAGDPSVGNQAGSASSSSASLRGYSGSRSAHTPTAASPWQPLVLAGMTNRRLLPPANEVCEGYVFTGVCLSTVGGGMRGCSGGACVVARGACVVAPGGHAWLLRWGVWLHCVVALGGMHGCSGGMCGCSGGHAWLLGGHVWLLGGCMVAGGACVVALGGHAWLLGGACVVLKGACMVAQRGHVWLLGGHVWLLQGGACVVFFDEIRSMSGQYASYWNAFLYNHIH